MYRALTIAVLATAACAHTTPVEMPTGVLVVENAGIQPITVRIDGRRMGWVQPGETLRFTLPSGLLQHSTATVQMPHGRIVAGPTFATRNALCWRWRVQAHLGVPGVQALQPCGRLDRSAMEVQKAPPRKTALRKSPLVPYQKARKFGLSAKRTTRPLPARRATMAALPRICSRLRAEMCPLSSGSRV
jgi:hypothetical protein